MADIRKRTGAKGTTYQVRFASMGSQSGYIYKTFSTLKEAREYRDGSHALKYVGSPDRTVRTVEQAIKKWLEICEKEGRDGRDPVTGGTLRDYKFRADIMVAYPWPKELRELTPPDIIEFRSWLLRNYSRDQAKKVLSSFHAVVREMSLRGHIAGNVAAGIAVRSESRYTEPVVIPTLKDVYELLCAADRLANSKNEFIGRVWRRYRPMLYLAADAGMRPQEYVAISKANLRDQGIMIDRALERGDTKISVPKSVAGRRFVDVRKDTFDMVEHFANKYAKSNSYNLVFPTETGKWQSIDNWRNRGFKPACFEAGLVDVVELDGKTVETARYSPYDLRHFFASMLIERRVNLKRIPKLMGHSDVTTTLNYYGHLIDEEDDKTAAKRTSTKSRCGKSVAAVPEAAVKFGINLAS